MIVHGEAAANVSGEESYNVQGEIFLNDQTGKDARMGRETSSENGGDRGEDGPARTEWRTPRQRLGYGSLAKVYRTTSAKRL